MYFSCLFNESITGIGFSLFEMICPGISGTRRTALPSEVFCRYLRELSVFGAYYYNLFVGFFILRFRVIVFVSVNEFRPFFKTREIYVRWWHSSEVTHIYTIVKSELVIFSIFQTQVRLPFWMFRISNSADNRGLADGSWATDGNRRVSGRLWLLSNGCFCNPTLCHIKRIRYVQWKPFQKIVPPTKNCFPTLFFFRILGNPVHINVTPVSV